MDVAVLQGRRIAIRGTVQGVGFRPWVYRIARQAGVTGRVRNESSGVIIEAFGDATALDRLTTALHHSLPPAARVESLAVTVIDPEVSSDFVIVESRHTDDRTVSIPADLATCDACVAEIFDPANRRYRYPFTNCTNCGPRFTIATDIPYDRTATTMAMFVMCPACRLEYENVADRRFHAQPNACPVCGPRLTLHTHTGEEIAVADPIAAAAAALRSGLIIAVKGLGGFHLACDATNPDAVSLLRVRKHRDEKPFAVMVRDLAAADGLACLSGQERSLLKSPERPIVLVRGWEGTPLAPNVAPRNRMIGLFLPYSPLHHLLVADANRPLVMTSGNRSDEPIAFRNGEGVARLGAIADLILLHDRNIQTRCDDSVATVISGRPVVLRRSRGYVPGSVRTSASFPRPILACGALLKNTFAVAAGGNVWLGPHIGDLENLDTYESYSDAIDRFERFLQIRPEVIAYDRHPDYMSTHYAQRRPEARRVGVQHHHAHVASVMAEHRIEGPVIGIAYDGTGYGTDGTLWGGELLLADFASFDRVGTIRPVALAGGDRAIKAPWRIAYALLIDAFGDVPRAAAPLLAGIDRGEVAAVHTLIRHRVQAPFAHGLGRYFDGFGALFLNRSRATYEGQVALEWNQIADPTVAKVYPFEIERTTRPWQLDFRPMMRAAIEDYGRGEPAAVISAAFHNTLAAATAAMVREVATRRGRLPVVASGGCFQNPRLAESVRAALTPEFAVWMHEQVPTGDGGIALGQAVIANAQV